MRPAGLAPPSRAARDVALLQRLAAGDPPALLQLFDQHAGALLALAQRLLGPGNEAEEVVHDVFVEVWRGTPLRREPVRRGLLLLIRQHAAQMLAQAPEILDQLPVHPSRAPAGRLTPVPTPALLREAVAHAIGEVNRFSPHAHAVRRLLGIERRRVETLLFALDDPKHWRRTPKADARTWELPEPGAGCFLRVPQGVMVRSPFDGGCHRSLVLQGRCQDGNGRVYGAGLTVQLKATTAPQYRVLPGLELICLLREDGGEPHGVPQRQYHQHAAAGARPAEGLVEA